MTTLTQDIKDKLSRLNILEKIIVVNLIIYVVGFLLRKLANIENSLYWLELPKDAFDALLKPWSIITYGFTHYDFWHIFFNMLILYFVARLFLNLFNTKLALNVYFLGIIFGALTFLLVYNIVPDGVLKPATALVGASAGVRAVLIFLCAYMPNTEVKIFTFNVKLKHIGIFLVVIDILGLFSENQGGHIAHLGGVLLGYLYATQLHKGNDIGKGFERFMDRIASIFKPSSKPSPLRTVHKRKKSEQFAGHNKKEFDEFNKQKQIDLILDKISKSGYESLTQSEKEFLFREGKN
ncbi:rhomboid family intramembrane serine protease [Winogradskyella sp. 3972H.M.0a.05]|uniref:rhomboid family intramembrane serine protease n=1 Tax=Winogradskyella sp. 3972H.M.0a.05 TaxID=2950277 RepID=UPI0033933F7B